MIEPQFDDACDFSEGLAEVRIGERRFCIDKEGRIIKWNK
ncbi:MAG: WG repeat-containing protein [candidate division WOR-3 bacterium]